jgi:hypothetical protein
MGAGADANPSLLGYSEVGVSSLDDGGVKFVTYLKTTIPATFMALSAGSDVLK